MMSHSPLKPALLVNLSANGGRARKRWARIEPAVRSQLPPDTRIILFEVPFDTGNCLRDLIRKAGINCFISAGGDGSVNRLLNALIELEGPQLQDFCIGAVGLGSSNDFLKPSQRRIDGIPVRMDLSSSFPADIGRVRFMNKDRRTETRYFIVNASVGVTAAANLLFNREDRVIRFLKPRSTGLAIVYAALKTIWKFRNLPARLQYDDVKRTLLLSNLTVLKNPHLSGRFRFDQPVRPDDGRLGLNICVNMNKFELIRTLADLSRGKFSGRPGRLTGFTRRLALEFPDFAALEADGEVTLANRLTFTVLPRAVQLLKS